MIPPFPKFYYPVLKLLSDGKIHTKKDLDKAIIGIFSLSASDCSERTAGGGQTRLYDRVQWCVSHLRKAGLVESPKRGESKITQKGIELLNSGVTDINQQTLANYSLDFAKFSNLKSKAASTESQCDVALDKTPSEQFEELNRQINESLIDELHQQIMDKSPAFFENLVVDLLVNMGYGGNRDDAAKVTQYSRDGGIDGIIDEDPLGLDKIYIQAKRWVDTVQAPEIHKFIGALSIRNASKGIFITTGKFSSGAVACVRNSKIVLIDGRRLCELMIRYNVGVSIKSTYSIKRIDMDYFNPED